LVCFSSLPAYCCYLTKPMSSDKLEAHLLQREVALNILLSHSRSS